MKFTNRILYLGVFFIVFAILKQASSDGTDYDSETDDNPNRGPGRMRKDWAQALSDAVNGVNNNDSSTDPESSTIYPATTETTPVDPVAANSPTNDSATTAPVTAAPAQEFKGPAAWLRICQPGVGKYIGAVSAGKNECPAGYWFKETMKVGCACGHGVWIFAKGWCDSTARIIIAKDGGCFNVNKDVKYIRNIGWANNAFMPYHFVGTTGLEYIQDVPRVSTLTDMATYFHPTYHQHIGAIFRERSVESVTGRFCLSAAGNVSRPLSFKYFVPKMPYFEKISCFGYANRDLSNFEYDAGYVLHEGLTLMGEIARPFQKPDTWVTDADTKKCSSECPAAYRFTPKEIKNATYGPDHRDPMSDEYFLQLRDIMVSPNSSTPTTSRPKQNVDKTYSLSNKTMAEIHEQTRRIIRLNIKSSVKNLAAPRVQYADYKLLQKARTIFDKVCPETELPSPVLLGMHRMFRIVVNESFVHYPFVQLGDNAETHRIWTILDTCFKEAKPMTFVYANETSNATKPNDEPKCGPGKFIGISYEFPTESAGVNTTFVATLPSHLWSNITKLDLVVETAWKTVMFSHYYCARHFKENSLDFSRFEQKLERFFNRWIQHRWFYPGVGLRGYKYSYQMFDLDRFSVALDKCVAAARSFSVYRKWIKRPVYIKHLGGKLFEEQTEIPDEIAGRTILDAINPNLNQFNKKSYCLPYWHAPASNPGLDYSPDKDYQAGCVKYVKEEWLNPFAPTLGKSGWRNTVDII